MQKLKLCKTCKTMFRVEDPKDICNYHKGKWMGAEKSKHYGTRSGAENIGLSLFWDCCSAENLNDPGCCQGKHVSYDDLFKLE